MRRFVLASHGGLAKGMESALQMVVAHTPYMTAYDLEDYSSPKEIRAEIETEVRKFPGDEWVIIGDIKGGSVCNELFQMCVYPNLYLVTNMSLPLVIGLYMSQEQDVQKLLEDAITATGRTTEYFCYEKLQKMNSQGKGDDDLW